MKKPNLFQFATKELSQDGFFAWFTSWADVQNAAINPKLHKAAQDFVRLLLGKENVIPIKDIKTLRQRDKIDIWVEVNDSHLVIIEDKTHTGAHGKQLANYKEIAQAFCAKNNRQLVCVYMKTGNESKASLENVRKNGYDVVDRLALLKLFEKHPVQNDIYADFTEYLKSFDDWVNQYRVLPVGKWTGAQWEGFYQWLDEKINVVGWGYVANPSGGFFGLWWHWQTWMEKFGAYLQLEDGALCLKMDTGKEEYRVVKNAQIAFWDAINKQAKLEGRLEIKRPSRLKIGGSMTCAVIYRKDWFSADDEVVNVENVVAKLKDYEQFLERCVKEKTNA